MHSHLPITPRARRAAGIAAVAILAGIAGSSTAAAAPSARGCHGQAYGTPSSGHYGAPGKGSSAVAGHPGFQEHYGWTVEGNVGRASIALRGFDASGAEQWYPAGMYSSGDSGAKYVSWGNSLATPAIRVLVPYGSPGVVVSFDC